MGVENKFIRIFGFFFFKEEMLIFNCFQQNTKNFFMKSHFILKTFLFFCYKILFPTNPSPLFIHFNFYPKKKKSLKVTKSHPPIYPHSVPSQIAIFNHSLANLSHLPWYSKPSQAALFQ